MVQKLCVRLRWLCMWGPRLSCVACRHAAGLVMFRLISPSRPRGWLMGVGPVSLVPGFCTDYDAWRVTPRTSGYLAS
jgi:hypothetical protein